MCKNIKSKIILISVITGLVLIGGISFLYLTSINNILSFVEQQNNFSEIIDYINSIYLSARKAISIVVGLFILISVLISSFLSRFVIYPKNKFIKSDEKSELKDKLNEVSSRKNQIETILLHMTDGIIAFNMKGDIILINPAAKKFLSISPEDNTFEDIFAKFKLDINMEKVIYLETWTSTEQRIQVDV